MIVILLSTFIIIYTIHFYWRVSKYPRGPFPLPIIGSLYQVKANTLHKDIHRFRIKYGDAFTLWFLERPVIILCTYELIKEAFVANGDALLDRPKQPQDDIFLVAENTGIVFANGENWREQRRASLHILRDFGVGKNSMETMIQQQIVKFFEHVESSIDKQNVDFRWPFQTMVTNVVNQLLFGFSYSFDNCERIMVYTSSMFSIFQDITSTFWPRFGMMFPILKSLPYTGYKAHGQYKERFATCLKITKEDVSRALKDYSVEDEPTCFVQAYYQQMENSEWLSLPNLENACSDFFMASTETTTNNLRWIALYLAKFPKIQEKLRQEIANVIGFDRLPSLGDRIEMPYWSAFSLELMRHSNPLPLGFEHESNKELCISRTTYPSRTSFIPQLYELFAEPKTWQNPETFDPERFLEPDGKTIKQNLSNQMIIFGIGKRNCAGESLAKAEVFLFSTALIQKYRINAVGNTELSLDPIFGLSFSPSEHRLKIELVNPNEYA